MRRALMLAAALGLTAFGLASCHAPEKRYFKVQCDFFQTRQHDPIGQPGVSPSHHLHDFFGSEFTETTITPTLLRSKATTCDNADDFAGYWSPAGFVGSTQQASYEVAVYYFGDPTYHVEAIPDGLRMVAGDRTATSPQDEDITKWACNNHPAGGDAPFDCLGEEVNLTVRFPSCWDGTNLDSTDHKSHMSYRTGANGGCPSTHTHLLPEIVMHTHFVSTGDANFTLACGSVWCGHADFINAWTPAEMDSLVTTCLNSADGDHPECQVDA